MVRGAPQPGVWTGVHSTHTCSRAAHLDQGALAPPPASTPPPQAELQVPPPRGRGGTGGECLPDQLPDPTSFSLISLEDAPHCLPDWLTAVAHGSGVTESEAHSGNPCVRREAYCPLSSAVTPHSLASKGSPLPNTSVVNRAFLPYKLPSVPSPFEREDPGHVCCELSQPSSHPCVDPSSAPPTRPQPHPGRRPGSCSDRDKTVRRDKTRSLNFSGWPGVKGESHCRGGDRTAGQVVPEQVHQSPWTVNTPPRATGSVGQEASSPRGPNSGPTT